MKPNNIFGIYSLIIYLGFIGPGFLNQVPTVSKP